ncbi:MAG TPA: hypothetical protein VFQ80_11885 [Thermomicrobiales bacterium]|jgi:hypothetical protein|nr:hypothetical protein [Thermomicrobiales bacterium]
MVRVDLTTQCFEALTGRAVAERRPVPFEAEVLIEGALGLRGIAHGIRLSANYDADAEGAANALVFLIASAATPSRTLPPAELRDAGSDETEAA